MKKNDIFLFLLCFFGAVGMESCAGKPNQNMVSTDKNDTLTSTKWDQSATAVGIPKTSGAVSAGNNAALLKNLTTPPANFQLAADGSNQSQYLAVVNAVNAYVSGIKNTDGSFTGGEAQKTQAVKVIQVQNYGSILGSQYTAPVTVTHATDACQTASYYSIPFVQRPNGSQSACTVDLNANPVKTLSGLDANGKFQIYGTTNGVVDTTKIATGTVYLVTYQLNTVTSHNYNALITIPDIPSGASKSYPLMLFAHGGDAGLYFKEIANVIQSDLGNVILAAPNYPGEYLCPVTVKVASKSKHYERSCDDGQGNTVAPVVPVQGHKSPVNDDVNGYLGLQNAISNLALGTPNFLTDTSASATALQSYLQSNLSFYITPKSLIPGPQTIAASNSRGGAVVLAALGREGLMFNNLMSGQQAFVPPVLFSSAVLYYSPSSFLVGQFRLMAQYLIAGSISDVSSFNALPMIPDFKTNRFFTEYRKAPLFGDSTELNNLIGWIGASDITYLAPYISVATQNWSKNSLMQLLNSQTILFPFFNDLSVVVPSTTNNKALFNYFADALLNDVPSSLPQCKIEDYPSETEDCSIRGLLLKGMKGGSFNGLPVPDLPPLLSATDANSVQGLANFLNTLGNNHQANTVFATLLSQNTQVNFITHNISNLLPALISSFGFAALFTGTDPYILSLSQNEQNAVYSQGAGQVFATDFADAAQTNPNAIAHHMNDPKVAAPGSIIFLHGTQDAVVPFTESLIAKTAMDAVFDNVYGTAAHFSPLVQNNIPAIGSQMYTFQPDNSYYNTAVGAKDKYGHTLCVNINADGTTPVNYNSTLNKCFGNNNGRTGGDGNEDHSDSAFFTSHLVNGAMQSMNVFPFTPGVDTALNLEMLYGADPLNAIFSAGTVQEQFGYFNAARQTNGTSTSGGTYPYNTSQINCTVAAQKTGVCYLYGYLNADGTLSQNKVPLFQRTMFQDETAGFAVMYTGAYDPNAQNSLLSPHDIVSNWLNRVALQQILSH